MPFTPIGAKWVAHEYWASKGKPQIETDTFQVIPKAITHAQS